MARGHSRICINHTKAADVLKGAPADALAAMLADIRHHDGEMPDGVTVEELMAAMNRSRSTADRTARAMVKAGKWVKGWKMNESQRRIACWKPAH